MPHATYEDAELILRLFELRREEKLRKARDWFQHEFSAVSMNELMEKYPWGSQPNTYMRMAVGYWDMAASFLVKGIVHEELFFESNGEMLFVWEKIKPLVGDIRKANKNPLIFRNLEKAAAKHIEWLNQNAPGAYEAYEAMVRGQR